MGLIPDDKCSLMPYFANALDLALGRWKGGDLKPDNNWIPKTTAKAIDEAGIIPFCKEMLLILRDSWKGPDEMELSQLGSGIVSTPPSVTLQVLRPAPILHP